MTERYDLGEGWPDLESLELERLQRSGIVEQYSTDDAPSSANDQFVRRSQEIDSKPKGLTPVTVVPDRSGPWSAYIGLGNQIPYKPDASGSQTILELPEWGFPEVWSIVLGLDYDKDLYDDPVGPMPPFFEVTALIDFGAGNVTQSLEMDWLNGSAISLPMNTTKVRAFYQSPEVSEAGSFPPPSDLLLRVSVVRGPLPGARPTRSHYFPFPLNFPGPAPNPDPRIIPIPPFAKGLMLMPNVSDILTSTPYQFYTRMDVAVRFFVTGDLPDSATYQMSQFVSSIESTTQSVGVPVAVPIPPFARFVHLGNAFSGTAQFILGF